MIPNEKNSMKMKGSIELRSSSVINYYCVLFTVRCFLSVAENEVKRRREVEAESLKNSFRRSRDPDSQSSNYTVYRTQNTDGTRRSAVYGKLNVSTFILSSLNSG
jgi:hypothetical protein